MRLAHFFGKRTIKTALAIGLGMLLYIALKSLDVIIKIDGTSLYKRDSGFRFSDFYSPFFAGIAAAYSLYPSKKESIAQAKNRVVASLLGGLVGMALTIGYGLIGKISNNSFFTWPNLGDKFEPEQYILPYILITLGVLAVVLFAPKEMDEKIKEVIPKNLCYYRFQDFAVDILKKENIKGEAVRFVLDYLKINKDDAMAIGDDYSDISMINEVKYGIAMGNGRDELKEKSFYVTSDVDEHGVKDVLNKFILKKEEKENER